MRAYALHDIDELRLVYISKPEIESYEVLVEVKAAGICGSDIPRIYKTGTYSYPLIPGHEFSGIVVDTGAEVDCTWKGKRVGVFPLIPCQSCTPCKKLQYEMCRKYSYLGSRTDGGFAEYVAVPQWNLIELPETVSYEAAALMEPMAVAVHAIRQIQPDIDDTVVVCGLGTIGIMLTMFLKEMGVRHVLTVGNRDFQKIMIEKPDVTEKFYCNAKVSDVKQWIMNQTGGQGADVFFECVGKNDTISQAILCTTPGGKIQLVGNPSSDINIDKNIYWKILRNQLTVKGSWNSSFLHTAEDDWHYALERLASGKIRPEQFITHKFAFDELEKGLHIMREKSEEYVKVMITDAYTSK